MSNHEGHLLGERAARQHANTSKTPPQWAGATPRWLVHLLPWTPVEAGVYRLNRVAENDFAVDCSPDDAADLPVAHIHYDEQPREYVLNTVTTTIQVHTRISDLFRSPMDQVKEQLTVLVEKLKEKQEDELLNNGNYGLLNSVHGSMRVKPRGAGPTPDDLDELIARVWKEPAFFLAHPRAIAAFGRECTKRGVPPPTVTLFGSPFLTWRGLPLIPTDKLHLAGNKTDILLVRTGEKKRGVVGLFQPGIPGEVSPSLSIRFMGINQSGAASYLASLYCSAAVLTEDALGVLEGVEVDSYYEYK
ncbi:family 2A encapsulin nanocompartment shell protein [Sorangium sp. So ce590]|uniref:family 2A encapsulin nanocompartment shell protein n=1 Tax=Sorangium sp. So ce590 TaxID=3133317 RepID=UPI003F614D6A